MQIYDVDKKRIAVIEDPEDTEIIKTLSSGDKSISFSYPKNGKSIGALRVENYIRTKTDEYVLKKIETGDKKNKYVATLNVEELQSKEYLYGFASETQTARACLEFAFEGTGWTVGRCELTKRRTVDIEETTNAWKILQEVLDTYRCECVIHSLQKSVDIVEAIGSDRGAYFMEGLNLRKLTVKSDTYDFYTRIYPVGKDGITPEIILGVPYIDNFQYSKKVIPRYWKDERYTITENLIEDATARVAAASKPYTSYTADVADLAAQSKEYEILSYDIGDMVTLVSKKENTKEKQRIVQLKEYPKHPEKNTCELSSVSKTFAQVQAETEEQMKSDAINVSESRMKRTLRGGYWTTEQVQAAITSSEEKISLSVQAARTEARDIANKIGEDAREYTDRMNDSIVEKMTNEYSTRLDQTATDLNIVIRSLESTVTSQGNEFTEFKQENETFFHHTSEGLEIGRKQDGGLMPFSTMLSDVRLEFRQEGKAVAYIQHDKLHITNVEAVRRWSVGAAEDGGYFDFISTRYGMGVKWREAQEEDTTTVQTMALKARSIRQEDYEQLIDESGVFEVITV
jgi:phage minor structural protein